MAQHHGTCIVCLAKLYDIDLDLYLKLLSFNSNYSHVNLTFFIFGWIIIVARDETPNVNNTIVCEMFPSTTSFPITLTSTTTAPTNNDVQTTSTTDLLNETESETRTVTMFTINQRTAPPPPHRLEDIVTKSCSSAGWNISVDMTLLQTIYPGSNISDIYWGTQSCQGLRQNNTLVFQYGLLECQATEQVNTYKLNRVVLDEFISLCFFYIRHLMIDYLFMT